MPAKKISVGKAQFIAATIWTTFKDQELSFADMLELCACLLVNVADKTESTDQQIIGHTKALVNDMRKNQRLAQLVKPSTATPSTDSPRFDAGAH